jgi:hypothetical protein
MVVIVPIFSGRDLRKLFILPTGYALQRKHEKSE